MDLGMGLPEVEVVHTKFAILDFHVPIHKRDFCLQARQLRSSNGVRYIANSSLA
jgi:hypothetical protein